MACQDSTAASDALNAAIVGPAKVASDAGSVEQHPLPDLIEADRYLSAKCSGANKRRGLRFNRLIPSGTVLDS